MKQQIRLYAGKDVEMLMVVAIILQHAYLQKAFLISKRANWADPFFDNLITLVNDAFSNILSINNATDLRNATQALLSIQKTALDNLLELKVQLEVDFYEQPQLLKNILSDLGFTAYYADAKKRKDQEALIQLLFKFDKALTPALKLHIVNAGTAPSLLDNISQHAKILRDANVTQETAKDLSKNASDEKITELNAIYKKVIGIARIASTFFKNQPLEKTKFSYAGNLKQLNLQTKKTDKPTDPNSKKSNKKGDKNTPTDNNSNSPDNNTNPPNNNSTNTDNNSTNTNNNSTNTNNNSTNTNNNNN